MQITIITSERPAILSKQISRDADGALHKTSSAALMDGRADSVAVQNMTDLAAALAGLGPNQAVAYGTIGRASAPLVNAKRQNEVPGSITRSDKHFTWANDAGVMYLDYDPQDGQQLDRDQLLGELFQVLPGLACGAWMWRASASGYIYDTSTGEELVGLKGQRLYVVALDATDIPRAGDVMFKRLWLAGRGHIELARNGAMLVRSLIDASVWQPSRLDFAAGAVCANGLVQIQPDPLVQDGPAIDTRAMFPDLTDAEEKRYRQMIIDAKSAAQQRSDAVREQFVMDTAQREGVSVDAVRARYSLAEERRVLGLDFPVRLAYSDDTVTVKDILEAPQLYHGKICLDPVEPEYNNYHPVGKIYNDEKGAYIDSKAHGGRVFKLGSVSALAFQQSASDGDAYNDLMREIGINGSDLAQVLDLVSKIDNGPFSDAEQVIMRAELKAELKSAKRLDKSVEAMINGSAHPTSNQAPSRQLPATPAGEQVSMDRPLNTAVWYPLHTTGKDSKPMGTFENFAIMLQMYGVDVEFNVITKALSITTPDGGGDSVLHDEEAVARLESLANLNNFPVSFVPRGVSMLAARCTSNPVYQWVMSAPWDGRDHIGELINQITFEDDEDVALCGRLVRIWMRNAVACGTDWRPSQGAGPIGSEYVLVLVDPAGGAGKTRWFRTLAPTELRKDSLQLDLTDKDSRFEAISTWLVELGELDGSFSMTASSRLKAFLSRTKDEIRLPYGRTALKYPRMTAFMGTVNDRQFLVDLSDNRRFLAVNVVKLNHLHNVNVQQAWAQAMAEVLSGAPLYLGSEDDEAVRMRNRTSFSAGSIVEDLITEMLNEAEENAPRIHLTATKLLKRLGLYNPDKRQLNEATRILRRNGFRETKNNGTKGFWVPDSTASAQAFAGKMQAVK